MLNVSYLLLPNIECFHMTSRRPYWCPKTMKRRPCWCPKPILWELNSFLMQTLSFVPTNLHRCWPREWKHSIKNTTARIAVFYSFPLFLLVPYIFPLFFFWAYQLQDTCLFCLVVFSQMAVIFSRNFFENHTDLRLLPWYVLVYCCSLYVLEIKTMLFWGRDFMKFEEQYKRSLQISAPLSAQKIK